MDKYLPEARFSAQHSDHSQDKQQALKENKTDFVTAAVKSSQFQTEKKESHKNEWQEAQDNAAGVYYNIGASPVDLGFLADQQQEKKEAS